MTKTRKEFDSLGSVDVPADKLWAAQTERSRNNFKIGHPGSMPIEVIYAFALLKKSIAHANCDLGILSKQKRDLISRVCDEIQSGKLNSHFPLVVWQTGSGTQTNMNINEVIVNRAKEISKKINLHPNDDVNKSQSSNDTFPTAMNIAALNLINRNTVPALKILIKSLKKKSTSFSKIIKIGRTHFMDATPITLGQEFSGYHTQLKKCIIRIENALKEIYFLAQGGTAVGTGLNTRKNFDKKIVREIKKITKLPFKPVKNKFAALASHDSIVNFSGTMNTTAVCLMKIANDIRFLGSGPRAGYGELILPENEPGSSIMPGKVNPTQSEAVTMVCVKVIGNHNGITMAGSHGHFELNVFKPLIAHNILQSIDLLADSSKNFALYCIKGLKADKEKINFYLENSLMLVTALAPKIGYDNAAKIAKSALKNKTTLKIEALKTGLINEKDYKKIVNPKKMIYPA